LKKISTIWLQYREKACNYLMACTALYGEACEFPSCLWTHFFCCWWI